MRYVQLVPGAGRGAATPHVGQQPGLVEQRRGGQAQLVERSGECSICGREDGEGNWRLSQLFDQIGGLKRQRAQWG